MSELFWSSARAIMASDHRSRLRIAVDQHGLEDALTEEPAEPVGRNGAATGRVTLRNGAGSTVQIKTKSA